MASAGHITAVLVRAGRVIFIGRELLDDGALDPIVERPQAFDPAVRLSPVAAPLRHRVVMLAHHIVNAALILNGSRSGGLSGLALALFLPLAEGGGLRIGDACSLAGPLLFPGRVGRRSGSLALFGGLELLRVERLGGLVHIFGRHRGKGPVGIARWLVRVRS